jgi:hypothetical protein
LGFLTFSNDFSTFDIMVKLSRINLQRLLCYQNISICGRIENDRYFE